MSEYLTLPHPFTGHACRSPGFRVFRDFGKGVIGGSVVGVVVSMTTSCDGVEIADVGCDAGRRDDCGNLLRLGDARTGIG